MSSVIIPPPQKNPQNKPKQFLCIHTKYKAGFVLGNPFGEDQSRVARCWDLESSGAGSAPQLSLGIKKKKNEKKKKKCLPREAQSRLFFHPYTSVISLAIIVACWLAWKHFRKWGGKEKIGRCNVGWVQSEAHINTNTGKTPWCMPLLTHSLCPKAYLSYFGENNPKSPNMRQKHINSSRKIPACWVYTWQQLQSKNSFHQTYWHSVFNCSFSSIF